MPVSENLGKIDHIVVLMLENRSFEKLHGFQRAVLALAAAAEKFETIDKDDPTAVDKLIDFAKLLVEEGEIAELKTVGEGIDFMTEKLQPMWEDGG